MGLECAEQEELKSDSCRREIVVNEVNFVRKCIATDTSKQDLWGKLVCTNFKISFITDDAVPLLKFQYRNKFLGEHDIPLTCIEQVVTVNDAKRKQKVLGSNQKLKFNPTELIIYCKDFRIVRFRFDEAGPESAKKVCLAIAHYSQPADPQLLFGFEYVGKRYYNPAGDKVNGVDPGGGGGGGGVEGVQTPLFDMSSDWDREIKRTGGSEWRVCSINESYVISLSLPEYCVVPVSLADQDLKQFSIFFTGQRIPLWCWNHPNGSALVRMSTIKDMVQQRKLDQRICNAITRSHPQRSDVYKSDLDKSLPTIQDVQAAFVRLKHICVIDPFEESDEKWLSSMESTHWLEYVRSFLKHSAELVYMLDGKHVSVILQEEEDRDLNCVISSLVQVMLDPHFRSIAGFQSLVQKEWVMAGYRFLDRCNHLKRSDKVESPLFLLFLDCVWQLLDQYPAAFEFTETYLTVLSDSLWIPVFSTFLFNCPQQRAEHSREFARSKNIHLGDEKVLQFPSVWDWSQQFTAKDQALFNNPLYVGKSATCVQNGAVKTFKRTKVCLAIAHYSQPADPQLLFGFEYVGKRYYNPAGDKVNGVDPGGGGGGGGVEGVQTPLFDMSSDWDREIKRTGGSEWRVCSINESYVISLSWDFVFICVISVNDAKRKQKVLGSNQKLKFNPTELIIYCKDFRIVRFRFDEAGPESAKKVLQEQIHAWDGVSYGTNTALKSLEMQQLCSLGDLRWRIARCDASISRLSAEVKTTQESIQNLAKEQKSSKTDVECKIEHIEIQISRVLGKIEHSVAQQEAKIKANQEDSSHQLHLLEAKLEGVSEDLKGQLVSVQNSLEKEQERAVTEYLTKIEQLSLVIKEQTDKNDKIVEERYGQLSMKLDKIEEVQKMNLGSHRVKHAEEKENDRINKIEKEIWKEIQDMRAETNAGFAAIHESLGSLRHVLEAKMKLEKDQLQKQIHQVKKMTQSAVQENQQKLHI
ncbi:Myotubularin-related protein 10 [Acipenser ruthenus]|uniref:Myotubularin-related protein 10 n=1 Tax=Acipenser ruthenus TaxID=7906 RepID=A0A444U4L4_ACIRT|nr:Myotubularin-related protein 10 [Acipenser ruthenus]